MARFCVHDMRGGRRVVNLQSDFLDGLDRCLVAPWVPLAHSPRHAQHLNPVIRLSDGDIALLIQSTAAVPKAALGLVIDTMQDEHDAVTRALDMVFFGF